MAWFLRAVELPDGRWECRWGLTVYGVAPDVASAEQRLREIAGSHSDEGVFELILHHRDGTVTRLGEVR